MFLCLNPESLPNTTTNSCNWPRRPLGGWTSSPPPGQLLLFFLPFFKLACCKQYSTNYISSIVVGLSGAMMPYQSMDALTVSCSFWDWSIVGSKTDFWYNQPNMTRRWKIIMLSLGEPHPEHDLFSITVLRLCTYYQRYRPYNKSGDYIQIALGFGSVEFLQCCKHVKSPWSSPHHGRDPNGIPPAKARRPTPGAVRSPRTAAPSPTRTSAWQRWCSSKVLDGFGCIEHVDTEKTMV